MRASAVCEEAGVPTSSLVCEGFLGQAAAVSRGLGLPNLPVAMIPGHIGVQTHDEIRRNVLDVTVDQIVKNLMGDLPQSNDANEPSPLS